jgi:outer membrane receptor protein involved in Fe transport
MKQPPQDDDYQFKYKWDIDTGNALTLAANGASDLAEADFNGSSDTALSNPDFAGTAKISNRYKNQSMLWDHLGAGGDRLKLGAENMRQDVATHWGEGYFDNEYLQQLLLKSQYDLPIFTSHIAHIGGEVSRNQHGVDYDQILFVCNEFDPNCGDIRRGRVIDRETIRETSRAFFLGDSWRIGGGVDLDWGAQYQTNSYTDEKFINPRAALSWKFAERWTATLKGGQYNRFPDLDAVMPKIGNPDLKSPRAKHIAAGLKQQLDDGWSWNAEIYYKKLYDLPLALDANQPDAARLYSNDMRGRAYGVDFLLNKKLTDRWYGWFALSLARSQRSNERTGATHEYRLDTPVVANWVLNYQATPRFDAGLRLSVHSGRATTPIIGLKDNPDFPDHVQPLYGEPFSERLPVYGRLDLRFKYQLMVAGHDSALILDIVNALNRRNVDDRGLDYKRSQQDRNLHLQDEVGMGIFPALTLRMTF